jgi:hypothetical protein
MAIFQFASNSDFDAAWVNYQISALQNGFSNQALIGSLLVDNIVDEDGQPTVAPGTHITYNSMTQCQYQIYSQLLEAARAVNEISPKLPDNIDEILVKPEYIGPVALWNYSFDWAFVKGPNGGSPLLPTVLAMDPQTHAVSRVIVFPKA